MKPLLKVAVIAIGLAAAGLATAQRIQVQIDGNNVYFPNAQAEYINGRVLVPLRGVFEQMGATVSWDQYSQTVSARKEGTRVRLKIGDHTAMVNGSPVSIDVPPMIIDGSTMVPIRFVSEALGAQVGWFEAQQLVTIQTSATTSTSVQTPPQRLHRFSFHANEVIPLTLDQKLSTIDNRKGDTFSATVRSASGSYAGLPQGTRIEGHIAAAQRMGGDKPAILDLAFDRIVFPSGRSMSVDGTLTSLDGRHVYTNANGVIVARQSGAQDQRMVYAGYGAGAGLLVGVLTKRPLEDTLLGGLLGYIAGQVQRDQRQSMTEITLDPGTEMGVRLSHDMAASW